MTWNWVDVIVLIILFRGVYVGYKEGLSVELVKLGTVFITYYCAIKYYAKVALWISDHSRIAIDWATVVAFLSIALISLLIVWLFFKLLGKIMTLQFESRISTLGGALVGIGRAALISAFLLFGLFFIPDPFVKKQVYSDSWYGQRATDLTPRIYAKLSTIVKEAQDSSKAMSAHYEQEKQRMERMMRESSKEKEEKSPVEKEKVKTPS